MEMCNCNVVISLYKVAKMSKIRKIMAIYHNSFEYRSANLFLNSQKQIV